MNKLISPIIGFALLVSTVGVFAAEDDAEATAPPEGSPTMSQESNQENSGDEKIAQMFKKLDSNKDGMIDTKEANGDKALAKEFKKIAKNGKLDQQGYQKWEQAKMAKQSTKTKS